MSKYDPQFDFSLATDIAHKSIRRHLDDSHNLVTMIHEGRRASTVYSLTLFKLVELGSIASGGFIAHIVGMEEQYKTCPPKSEMALDFPRLSLLAVYRYIDPRSSGTISDAVLWALARFRELEGRDAYATDALRTRLTPLTKEPTP